MPLFHRPFLTDIVEQVISAILIVPPSISRAVRVHAVFVATVVVRLSGIPERHVGRHVVGAHPAPLAFPRDVVQSNPVFTLKPQTIFK